MSACLICNFIIFPGNLLKHWYHTNNFDRQFQVREYTQQLAVLIHQLLRSFRTSKLVSPLSGVLFSQSFAFPM